MIKRLASRLPARYQQELKRLHFARQIRRGIFTAAEESDTEFPRLASWAKPGDCVLDVGANVGNYTARLSQIVGPSGRVLAFEPVPETFELLAANLSRFPSRNVTLFNTAASDESGIIGVTLPRLDNGLENPYMAQLTSSGGQLAVFRIAIDTLAIPVRVAFIKVDVEGHELPALQGMRELLKRDHPTLVVEGRSAEVAAFLATLGYTFEESSGSPNRVFQTPASLGH